MLSDRVELADEIVKEYLVRRGLVLTLDAFDRDAEKDPLQGFVVCDIINTPKILYSALSLLLYLDLASDSGLTTCRSIRW